MGGKGGLNILPQKKWNVYNWDNRIKVEKHEKRVNEEIEKIENNNKFNKFENKIRQIKKGKTNDEFYHQETYDKNKIFKDVMQRETIIKRIENDIMIEKMRKPMKADEKLTLFDDINIDKKLKEMENSDNVTFGNSLKNNLRPWYVKKKKEDFEIFKYEEESKIDSDIISKKRNRESKSKDDEMTNFIKEMKKERINILKKGYKK